MEDKFRRIEEEQLAYTRESSSFFGSAEELLFNRTRSNQKSIPNGTNNSENIIATQKLMQEIKEKIIGENILNKENMENLVTQKIESQFRNMKQELEKTEEKQ